MLRILALVQAEWGKRKARNIKTFAPADWQVETLEIPFIKLPFIDDPEEYLNKELNQQDLIISLGEEPAVADLITEVARRTKANAVIAPVDNREWLPPGLVNQLRKDLEGIGVAFAAPVPFCTLTEEASGNKFIKLFAKHFGRPEVEIIPHPEDHGCKAVDEWPSGGIPPHGRKTEKKGTTGVTPWGSICSEDKIQEVIVKRDCPCGNTRYVASQLKGVSLREAEQKAGLAHHYYPCWSTMTMDEEFGDTLMHRAGLMTKLAVEKALESYRKQHTSYLKPG